MGKIHGNKDYTGTVEEYSVPMISTTKTVYIVFEKRLCLSGQLCNGVIITRRTGLDTHKYIFNFLKLLEGGQS